MDQEELRPSQTPDLLQNEAMGDLSGLKGAYYHFVYALYLLLDREAQEVAFYAGNDLRVHPPIELDQDAGAGILATAAIHDRWIQLKNTDTDQAWTMHRLLSDKTLFLTLLLNALHSEHLQRSWSVRLVSPALIRSKGINDFLKAPANKPELDRLFKGSIIDAYWRWNEWLQEQGTDKGAGIDHVRAIAKQVLKQIADSPVVPLGQISDRIRIAMLEIFHDSTVALQNAFTLRGALMEVGEVAAADPVAVSLGWLEKRTHLSLRRQDLLGIDPAQASDAQAERHTPDRWDAALCVPRQDLLHELQGFLSSDRTLFVLTGDSGSGKSWASAYYAQRVLHGSIRALISGSLIPEARSLVSLVADAFRALARPGASDEEIARLVGGAASARGPFVLIADDVPLTNDAEGFSRTLEVLSQDAEAKGAKLVVVARRSVWQRLASKRHLASFLFRSRTDFNAKPDHSYELTTLTDSEIQSLLERRLPATAAPRRLALRLREPEFAPLRNPYLLSVYINRLLAAPDQNQQQVTESLDMDSLLDNESERRFQEVARHVQCDYAEMAEVRSALVPHLWQERRAGSRPADLVRLIEQAAPGLGRRTLAALQIADVLTSADDLRTANGTITYANPQFGDRLTALWLAQQITDDMREAADMVPGYDDGAMAALVRGAIDACGVDKIDWTQSVLERDAGWLSALAQGLAQRREGDWRIVATLTAWANRKEPYAAANAMRALGSMAAWSSDARAWVAALYDDEESSQDFKGEIAMGSALDVVPGWAKRRVSLRLRRDLRRNTDFPADSKKRARFIRHALEPLKHTSNPTAAAAAHSLLAWLTTHDRPSSPFGDRDVREQFEFEVDIIRGQIALHGPDIDLQAILKDLTADDWKVRIRAARALLPVAQERPEQVKDTLFAQVRREQEILAYLLQPLIHYKESDPDDLLDIIQATQALKQRGCGIALVLLGQIAWSRPNRVRQLLPDHLDSQIGAEWRAILSGELALAWWQYAANAPKDSHTNNVLEALSLPDFTEVSGEYQAFAAHGAAVAVMARMGAEIVGLSKTVREEDVFFHDLAMQTGIDVLYTDFRRVLERHAAEMACHPLAMTLIERLTEAVTRYKAHEMHPIKAPFCEWQFRIGVVSSDSLAALAVHMSDPTSIITGLPRDWPALRVCNALLEAEVITDAVINIGCQICAAHANVWGNVSRDRDRFIQGLRIRGRLPQEYDYLASSAPIQWSDGEIARIDADVSNCPGAVLELLHSHVTPANAISFFWEWSTESPDWRVVLLGHIYRAAFRETPLSRYDCERFCGQMLEAIDGLPASSLKDEYRLVYSALRSFGKNEVVDIPELNHSDDFLSQSHYTALAVIRSFQQGIVLSPEWFRVFLAAHQGWAEDDYHWVFEGTVHSGSPNRISVYFPPALRIALTFASLRTEIPDLFTEWLNERNLVNRTLSSGACKDIFIYGRYLQSEDQQNALSAALTEVESLRERLTHDAAVLQALGHLLMLSQRFEEAKNALEQCLHQPAYRPEVHICAHYNLACALTRLGNVDGSRQELLAALAANTAQGNRLHWTREQVTGDPDFASLRETAWFQEAITPLPQTPGEQAGSQPVEGDIDMSGEPNEILKSRDNEEQPGTGL